MSKSNTFRGALCSLGLIILLAQSATAQSVLNFPRAHHEGAEDTGLAITNPNAYYADVQLAFYASDGSLVANGLINPVSYRIPPRSQLSRMISDLFAAGRVEGWIQATSTSSGLVGFSFTGDFATTLEGGEPAVPMLAQSLPLLREGPTTRTDVNVINPGTTTGSITINYYTARGDDAGNYVITVPAHGIVKAPARLPTAVSARVTSSVPVIATATVNNDASVMFVNGQAIDQSATTRIVPHFQSGNGLDAQLVLSNPNATAANVTISLFSAAGGSIHPSQSAPLSLTIPARGTVTTDTRGIIGQLAAPAMNGWLQIDSPNLPLNGLVVLDSALSLTAVPIQRVAVERMMFSQFSESGALSSFFALVNPGAADVSVDVSLLRTDGSLFAQRTISIRSRTKLYVQPHDLIPEAASMAGGFVTIRSSAGIYGVEVMTSDTSAFLATVVPQRPNLDFSPNPPPEIPRIIRLGPGREIVPGTRLSIALSNVSSDTQILLGNQTLNTQFSAPGIGVVYADVPAMDPGYASLRVRVRGLETAPIKMKILPSEEIQPLIDIDGRAFYQKIEVTDTGLDLNRRIMVPIRNARVEVVDASSGSLISVSETDIDGRFNALVPQSAVTIRVLSRLRNTDLRVVDNTNGNQLYTISTDFDIRERSQALIVDTTRASGAFNILEMIQRGNDLVRLADPRIITPTPAIQWSVRNTAPRATAFGVTSNTAWIRGDRATDSDEFDDAVIIHEYAHILAARFSRDDSPGGMHGIGDSLDPRLAWSEGWANFFSSAARSDAVYRDSMVSANGSGIYRFDIEDNRPPTDKPGYDSEASIHSLLWDLFDAQSDVGDTVQYPFAVIWDALTDLRNDRFVYLPYFLERFLTRNPSETDSVRAMVLTRSIDFQPNVRPSVTNPFPKGVSLGSLVQGSVDSLSLKRFNLATSSHFYTFTTSGEAVAIRLDITGLGNATNGSGNDLDIFLLDENGRMIDGSDRGLNGQSELISRRLPAGTYVIEVRSFYTNAETNGYVYNSGDYRLSITAQ